ncbi:MAG TPA: ATP-binding protein [Mycobacteriales bacterium]|nr:ATP-binding protein [Mycobacteriales bacterium]
MTEPRRPLPPAAVTLPPDGSSPALARRHLRTVLLAAGHGAVLDDALLLVTELVTNAVVHAGTDVELALELDDDRVLVQVSDRSPGSTPVVRGDADAPREGGRGLFLLDALAPEWGTTHARDRKTVWFRLGPSSPVAVAEPAPPVTTVDTADGDPTTLDWLLALPGELEQQLSPAQVLTELLHRLCDALAVDEAALLVESDRDPDTWLVAAARGDAPSDDAVAELRRTALHTDRAVVQRPRRTVLLLRGRGGPFGALVLERGSLSSRDTAVARLAAERLGMVLRDDRADVAQRRQRGSLALLAEASDMFAATLDVQLAVTLATQLVVPRLASWAAVYTVADRGVQLASVSHEDEERTAALRVALSSSRGTEFAERLARDLAVQRPAEHLGELAAAEERRAATCWHCRSLPAAGCSAACWSPARPAAATAPRTCRCCSTWPVARHWRSTTPGCTRSARRSRRRCRPRCCRRRCRSPTAWSSARATTRPVRATRSAATSTTCSRSTRPTRPAAGRSPSETSAARAPRPPPSPGWRATCCGCWCVTAARPPRRCAA